MVAALPGCLFARQVKTSLFSQLDKDMSPIDATTLSTNYHGPACIVTKSRRQERNQMIATRLVKIFRDMINEDRLRALKVSYLKNRWLRNNLVLT